MFVLFRALAVMYLIAICLATAWAWYIDIQFFHSNREHLLPDFILAFLALPSSILLDFIYDLWPKFFGRPFMQLAALTFFGMAQVVLLFMIAGFFRKHHYTRKLFIERYVRKRTK